jgi:hypothetical protein
MSTRTTRLEDRGKRRKLIEQSASRPRPVLNRNVLYALKKREQCSIPRVINSPSLCWCTLLKRLLREKLGPCWGDMFDENWNKLVISDESNTKLQRITIMSKLKKTSAAAHSRLDAEGRLKIVLSYNHPQYGFLEAPCPAGISDWSKDRCKNREARITLIPMDGCQDLVGFVPPHPNPLAERRFLAFPQWNHAAYRTLGPSPGRLDVYHDDYNTSYPVVWIVAEAMRRFFLNQAEAAL